MDFIGKKKPLNDSVLSVDFGSLTMDEKNHRARINNKIKLLNLTYNSVGSFDKLSKADNKVLIKRSFKNNKLTSFDTEYERKQGNLLFSKSNLSVDKSTANTTLPPVRIKSHSIIEKKHRAQNESSPLNRFDKPHD